MGVKLEHCDTCRAVVITLGGKQYGTGKKVRHGDVVVPNPCPHRSLH